MNVEIKRINDKYIEIPLPKYETAGAAGMDIAATIDADIIIKAGEIAMVPTNLSIGLPSGYECQVRSRSGLAAKNGIFCLNAPGTIDSDYRGEIKVILANFSKEDFVITNGMRIAQIVIAKYEQVNWELKQEISNTDRADGGFGSTGVN